MTSRPSPTPRIRAQNVLKLRSHLRKTTVGKKTVLPHPKRPVKQIKVLAA